LFVGIVYTPIAQGFKIDKSKSNYEELEFYLRAYGLNKKSTIGDFVDLLYKFVNKQRNRNPYLTNIINNDIKLLTDILDKIGILESMTISQALPIIEKNKEEFQKDGINLFCSVCIYGHPGNGLPFFRLFKVLYGVWQLFWGGYDDNIKIYNPKIGLQSCQGRMCEERSGRFIGLITLIPPAIYTPMLPVTPLIIINGLFTLFSKSNVPFVNTSSNSIQSQCKCYQ
jgi:hypothetical protein